MAYRRKRTTRRRRAYPRKGRSLAAKAYKLAKRTAAVCKPELKYQDYVRNDFASATTSGWEIAEVPFAGIIPQIEDKGGRVGDQIYAQRLSMTIRVRMPLSDGDTFLPFVSARFVLVRLKNQPTTSISTSQIFANESISSYLTWDQRYNVTKLWDKTITLTQGGVSEKTIKLNKKIRSRVQYINNGQAVTKNQLILFVIGDETAVTSDVSLQYLINTRVTYTDC